MTLLRYLPFIAVAALTIFTVVDIILIDRSRVKGLPKIVWILICLIVLVVGPVIWFLIGRERLSAYGGGSFGRRGPRAPDDDPEFLRKLSREQAQEERIRQLEERLREIDDDKPDE
jgi:hypothetical protein